MKLTRRGIASERARDSRVGEKVFGALSERALSIDLFPAVSVPAWAHSHDLLHNLRRVVAEGRHSCGAAAGTGVRRVEGAGDGGVGAPVRAR